MRILLRDWKHGVVRVRLENPDDVWVLQRVLEPGDSLKGSTERKVKLGGSDERAKVTKKRVRLTVKLEKTEYASDGGSLRALGSITDAPDDVPRGEHHSFNLEPGVEITIKKLSWPGYVKQRLEEATRTERALLVLLFDREEARLYSVTKRGIEEVTRLKGDVQKKAVDEKKKESFFGALVKEVETRLADGRFANVVAGAPAFWKEYVEKTLPKALKPRVVFTTISSVEKTAIRELLKRPEVEKLLQQSSTLRELALVEEALDALGNEKLAYGLADVRANVKNGNVAKLLLTEGFIAKEREKGVWEGVERLLQECESNRGEVHVLATKEAGDKITGLGGVVALKRW